MKKLTSRWSNICSKDLRFRISLLCKIFIIWLLLQFFLQTFITFQLWRDGRFWTLFWMWKEFILLIFVVILLRYVITNLKVWINSIKNKENTDKITWKLLLKNTQSKFVIQFILYFVITTIVLLLLAVWLQHVWVKAFVLSAKYDLFWFFIFGIWICLSLLFFTEKDKDLLELYNKLIIRSLRLGLIRWVIVWLMPTILRHFWYDPLSYEWTVWQRPPVAYYTLIDKWNVRNQFLFERPTSFGFWLIAFFPVFVLWFLRNKKRIDQLFPIAIFWLLILSTRSRAWIAIRALEAILIFFILYRKSIKKYFVRLIIIVIIWLSWLAYLWRWMMVREHSNTGHLELMKAWRNIAKENLLFWWWAGYSWPASHQLCYTDEPVDIFQDIESIHLDNQRCELLRKENVRNQISTYGFNPENQYLQILMEYWIVWILLRLWLCLIILRYTAKMIWIYRKKNKSPYQELLYYSLLWFWIWFIWLCAEWLVLHSLVDRMVIYPFFLLYWITVWLWENVKDKQYIPPEPKKKGKKKKTEPKKASKKKKSK
jgi:hypothetical protein